MPLTPGTKLAHYEVTESIGAGGMGEVYRARDTKLGREVAIKVLPEEFARDKERLDRFEREARLLAQLNHPNIATLHGLEEHEGQKFLVMELVEGETLAERIADGPIPIDEAIPLFIQIAEGLEAAHEKGIIHRDLKPANVKIGSDGKPKILDFGLAKAFVGDEAAQDFSQSPTLTKGTALGAIMGTASYMSPEQARGKPVDKRTDIWAFGCVLFEALTGKRAFVGDSVTDVLAAIVNAKPDWSSLPSGTPTTLRELLSRSLRKDVRKRVQHIGDVRIALEEVHTSAEVAAAPAPVETAGRMAWWILGSALLAAALAWWLKPAPSVSAVVTRATIPLEPGTTLARTDISTRSVAISPDGQTVAYVAVSNGVRQLYLRSLDALSATALPGAEGAQMPFFSADGEWIAFSDDSGLRKAPLGGGPSVRFYSADFVDFRGASWGDDGIIALTAANNTGVSLLDSNGGELRTLTTLDRDSGEKSHRFPEALPGSEHILFTSGTGDIDSWDEASIAFVSRSTGERETLAVGGSAPVYSPTGHLIYAGDGALLAVPFNLRSLRVEGTPVTVVEDVATDPHYGHAQFALSGSGNGSLVYARGGPWRRNRRIVAVSPDGRVDTLIDEDGPYRRVSVSPDARSIAMEREGANSSVWVYDRNRRTMSRLTFAFDSYSPRWAPDGRWISFYSNRQGSPDIYRQLADRSDEAELVARGLSGVDPGHSWSSDSTLLAYETRGPSGIDIGLLSLESDREDVKGLDEDANEREPAFSPDMKWLAYSSDESGRREIFLRTFPDLGRKFQVSTDGGYSPRWGADGRRLFYRDADRILVVEVTSDSGQPLGVPQVYLDLPFPNATSFDIAKDGRVIANEDVDTNRPPTELVLVQNFFTELNRLVPTNN